MYFHNQVGCEIGARPIDLHLKGLRKLNVSIEEEAGFVKCISNKIIGSEIELDFPSVGATENIMLASVLCEGETIIKNAAREPEIIDLQNFLNSMGAQVSGSGTNVIRIKGVLELKNTSYSVMPDRIEAGTLLCAGAITGGNITITNTVAEHISPIIDKLRESGCEITIETNLINLVAPKKLKHVENIKTMPYPGFPTDMQPLMAVILSVAQGTSIIIENIFENRYKYVNELIRMGAKIKIEGRTAIITGVNDLSGTQVTATDLRGGAALMIAGLKANYETRLTDVHHICRGYEYLEQKLNSIGANITREG